MKNWQTNIHVPNGLLLKKKIYRKTPNQRTGNAAPLPVMTRKEQKWTKLLIFICGWWQDEKKSNKTEHHSFKQTNEK